MKKFCLVLLIILMAIMLCSCSSSSYKEANTNPDNYFSKDYFTIIKSWDGGIDYPTEYIVYANDTGVMYYVFLGGHNGGITPLYNADGTLQIYKGE